MMDGQGRQSWALELDIYGKARPGTQIGTPNACPFRYPGQYEDEETGLYYNRFRYYDPEGGGYVSQDPIGLDGGFAVYGYVEDPIIAIDSLGLIRGGSYYRVRKTELGGEVHHMPANSISPISRGCGPAILMSTADHRRTASYGSSRSANRFRKRQKSLLQQGRFADAMTMDINDLRQKFGKKYNKSIDLAVDYAREMRLITKTQANEMKVPKTSRKIKSCP